MLSDGHVIWLLAPAYVFAATVSVVAFFWLMRLFGSGADPDGPDAGGDDNDGGRPRRPLAPRGPWGDGLPSTALDPPDPPRARRSTASGQRQRRSGPAPRRPCPQHIPARDISCSDKAHPEP